MKHAFLNRNKIVPIAGPAAATTGAVDSDWVSVAHGTGVAFQVVIEEGRANQADDNTITLRQAKTAAGGDPIDLVPRRAYRRSSGTSLADAAAATPEVIERDADGNLDLHVDGDVTTIYDIEIDASELDVNDDYAFVQARTAAVGSSTTTVTMTAIACGLRQILAPQHLANVLA
ncbi:MAG: hypothetical protein F4Z28_05105 [Gammaproteobacteria bacterium]|nr:hypothetical protein [Gammaproteobacteria bacterium]